MSEELKPCRNCGSSNLHYYATSKAVECNNCSEEEWQAHRPVEDTLRAELAATKAERDALIVHYGKYCHDSCAICPVIVDWYGCRATSISECRAVLLEWAKSDAERKEKV